jgi:hypothetical protein
MTDASPVIDAWARVKSAVLSVFNSLNALGAIVLAYALANPTAATELVQMLPEQYRPFAPLAALAWFVVVQVAKMSAIKKATAQ